MRLALAVAAQQLDVTVDDAILGNRCGIFDIFELNLAQAFISLVADRCCTSTRFL